MLLAECRNLDGDVDGGRRDQLSNDWEVKSLELEQKLSQLRKIGESIVKLENCSACLEAVILGDSKTNSYLAKASEIGRKTARKNPKK